MFSNELMFNGILSEHSLFWIFDQHIFDKVNRFFWQMIRNFQLTCVRSYDFLNRLLSANIVKWSLANQQLVAKHTHAPQIHRDSILFSFKHLWRRIVNRATKSGSSVFAKSSPTKIT